MYVPHSFFQVQCVLFFFRAFLGQFNFNLYFLQTSRPNCEQLAHAAALKWGLYNFTKEETVHASSPQNSPPYNRAQDWNGRTKTFKSYLDGLRHCMNQTWNFIRHFYVLLPNTHEKTPKQYRETRRQGFLGEGITSGRL